MEIKKINGEIIFKANVDNIKDAVEEAVMRCADLYGANLGGADLRHADLRHADLRHADLRGANLRGANLSSANLRHADLRGANLRGADLRYADLCGANLGGADLCGANLSSARSIPYIPLACPSDGEFTGWKKVGDKLIRLLIPADAKRSSAASIKCRCEKAKVVAITSLDEGECYEEVTNGNYAETIYRVGEMVYPDSYDDDRWNECSHGIHYFINKQDAINYL
ncbi:MAG: pentapeptide repeat-containing protein [Clostridia bacterium]|nr:pentapeptide repeat-containing protein [Clostridia bacterium]